MKLTWREFALAQLFSCCFFESILTCNHNANSATERSNALTLQLYKQLKVKADQNVLFSGYSLYSALMLLFLGAKARGKEELRRILLLSNSSAQGDLETFSVNRRLITRDTGISRFRSVDKVWIDNGHQFVTNFASSVHRYFGEDTLERTYFAKNPREAEARINEWVSKATNGVIEYLVPIGFVNAQTEFLITNGVHFKANWKDKFDHENTADRPFEISPEKTVNVPTMATVIKVNFSRIDNLASLVNLPYENGKFSMLILLPTEKTIDEFLEGLDTHKLQELIEKMEPWKMKILLPKFKVKAEYHIKDCFVRMGLSSLFSTEADLSGILEGSSKAGITDVIHKAAVAVAEEGTEAGAGTAVLTGRSSLPTLAINKPFAFFIRHVYTGTILFFGKIIEPIYK